SSGPTDLVARDLSSGTSSIHLKSSFRLSRAKASPQVNRGDLLAHRATVTKPPNATAMEAMRRSCDRIVTWTRGILMLGLPPEHSRTGPRDPRESGGGGKTVPAGKRCQRENGASGKTVPGTVSPPIRRGADSPRIMG